MSPEPVTPLAAAARRRHQQAPNVPAPRFDSSKPADNPSPTPPSLPRHKVSRAWLYTQPDIRAAAAQLRRINGRSATFPCPPSSGHPSRPLFAVWKPRTTAADSSAGTELRQQLAVAHANLREARRHIPQVSAK